MADPPRPLDPPRPAVDTRIPPALLDRYSAWRHDPRAGVAVLLAVAVAAGLVWYRQAAGAGGGEPLGQPPASPRPAPGTTAARPLVHVAGAVVRPGVYLVPEGARVSDALAAAGGPSPDADLDRLNLAGRVADGQQVHVPRRGDPTPAAAGPASSTGGPTGPVDLNAASEAELEALPGVGPSIARAIVEYRRRYGRFASVRDLLKVDGIGTSKFEKLRPLVTV